MRFRSQLLTGSYVILLATALGFGAEQETASALAAPPTCTAFFCNNSCVAAGSDGGTCHPQLGCLCYAY